LVNIIGERGPYNFKIVLHKQKIITTINFVLLKDPPQ
jgi:hypothetical protein